MAQRDLKRDLARNVAERDKMTKTLLSEANNPLPGKQWQQTGKEAHQRSAVKRSLRICQVQSTTHPYLHTQGSWSTYWKSIVSKVTLTNTVPVKHATKFQNRSSVINYLYTYSIKPAAIYGSHHKYLARSSHRSPENYRCVRPQSFHEATIKQLPRGRWISTSFCVASMIAI